MSEPGLVALARALAGQLPWDSVEPIVRYGVPPRRRLSPAALQAIEQTLAQAIVLGLARWGGAVPEGGLRLWQRHAPPRFTVSAASLELLIWLASSRLALGAAPLLVPPVTEADELLRLLALEGLEQLGLASLLARQPGGALVQLAACPILERAGVEDPPVAAYDRWMIGDGAIVLEALGPHLARVWAAARPGRLAEQLLPAFMDAADGAGRRDLAGWIIDAGRQCQGGLPPGDPQASLTTRAAQRRTAASLLRAVARWGAWNAEHRSVGFVDEGYAAAQALLLRYERLEVKSARRIHETLAELECL